MAYNNSFCYMKFNFFFGYNSISEKRKKRKLTLISRYNKPCISVPKTCAFLVKKHFINRKQQKEKKERKKRLDRSPVTISIL